MNPFLKTVKDQLEAHPEESFVTDKYIAVLIDDSVLIITGDFAGASPNEVNQKITTTLVNLI